jgi:protein-tyrosine kinase
MTKIYEALENAKVEVLDRSHEMPPLRSGVGLSSPKVSESLLDGELRIYQGLAALVPDSTRKIIQFIGSREGEGTSTVVREFARVSALKFDKLVLLLDADHHHPTQHLFFNIHVDLGWQDVVGENGPIDKALYRIGDTRLFLCPSSRNPAAPSHMFSSLQMDLFLKKVREKFDLVLIDSQPATTSTDGLAISSKVDGVVLVVEAEKTRWPVAETVRDKIKRSGGNILGVVLNKRRYYIPEWIYKRL